MDEIHTISLAGYYVKINEINISSLWESFPRLTCCCFSRKPETRTANQT